jgi:sialic acid synthase SpsE
MTDYNQEIQSADRTISATSPTYLIAEIGTNHAGDLSIAKEQIRTAAQVGADAVKFQMFHADEFVRDESLTYTYEDANGEERTVSQYEMFRELELPETWIPELLETANEAGVDWFVSVADEPSLQTALEHDVPFLKLASEDLINVDLLQTVSEVDVPIIVSRGMADEAEIENALSILSPADTPDLILLHCVSCYPAPIEEMNLRQIETLRQKFGCLVGLSDHTKGTTAGIAAVTLGATVIEKHFTMDQSLPGPDQSMSTPPDQFREFVQRIRETEETLGDPEITYADCESDKRVRFRRGIVAARDIEPGEIIAEEDIAYRRPCEHLKPYQKRKILGKEATISIPANDPIQEEYVD